MIDNQARQILSPALNAVAKQLKKLKITPLELTVSGFVFGVICCVAILFRVWYLALSFWILNRILDGLDGPLARLEQSSDLGGFLDLVFDFTIYGSFVICVGLRAKNSAYPALILMLTYYISAVAFFVQSALLAKQEKKLQKDNRSLPFIGGVAEGAETIVAYSAVCLFPNIAYLIFWIFSTLVGITALQRIYFGIRLTRPQNTTNSNAS